MNIEDEGKAALVHSQSTTLSRAGAASLVARGLKDLLNNLTLASKAFSVHIPASVLRKMLRRTSFAIPNESRYTIHGALMVLSHDSIKIVATDGHRLAFIERDGMKFDVAHEQKVIVPRKTIAELAALIDESGVDYVGFTKHESTLAFRVGNRVLNSNQLDRQFPDYKSVLVEHGASPLWWLREAKGLREASGSACSVMVNGDGLARAIQSVSSEAGSHPIRIILEMNRLVVSTSGMLEIPPVCVEATYTGVSRTVLFNSRYLSEFLETVAGEKLVLTFKEALSAAEFFPLNDDEYIFRYFVMPMKPDATHNQSP